jgi:hypothetical protein
MNDYIISTSIIIDALSKKGAIVDAIPDTNAYRIKLEKRIYYFIDGITPLIPYSVGILFSNEDEVREVFENHFSLKFSANRNVIHKIFITKNGFFQVLKKVAPKLIGNGKLTLDELIARENLQRINNGNILLYPLNIDKVSEALGISGDLVIEKNENVGEAISKVLDDKSVYQDVTKTISPEIKKQTIKMLKLFPHLGYLSIDGLIKTNTVEIASIQIDLGMHMFFPLHKNTVIKKAAEIIADLILEEKYE